MTTDYLTRGFLTYYMIPDAEYGIMKKHWIAHGHGQVNKQDWRIQIVDKELMN